MMIKDVDLRAQKALKDKPVALSADTLECADGFDRLYHAGKVFVENSCAVRRDPDVYVACCKLADALSRDLARHVGGAEAHQHEDYEIYFNARIKFRVKVGPGKCAVGIYDSDRRYCSYEGLVSC